MRLSTVYVGVEEMERALDFYRAVLGMEPAAESERFSVFEFETVDFGLYNAAADGDELVFGTNCVPNFEVKDVEAAYERIEGLASEMVHDEVLRLGDYHTFRFVDTEGNVVEVYGIDRE